MAFSKASASQDVARANPFLDQLHDCNAGAPAVNAFVVTDSFLRGAAGQ